MAPFCVCFLKFLPSGRERRSRPRCFSPGRAATRTESRAGPPRPVLVKRGPQTVRGRPELGDGTEAAPGSAAKLTSKGGLGVTATHSPREAGEEAPQAGGAR